MKSEIKQKVIEIIAPYVSPAEIEKVFGIKYQTIYHYADKYQIPKWRASRSERKAQALDPLMNEFAERKLAALNNFEETEKQLKEESINEAKRLINGCY